MDGGEKIFDEARKVGAHYFLDHPEMMDEVGMIPEFSAHITGAGRLSAKHVIHSVAVGLKPRQGLYCNGEVIGISTRNVLDLARGRGLKSVGFPALGTGLYSVPLEEAVEAMTDEFARHLGNQTSVERIGLVLYSPSDYSRGKVITDRKFNSR